MPLAHIGANADAVVADVVGSAAAVDVVEGWVRQCVVLEAVDTVDIAEGLERLPVAAL